MSTTSVVIPKVRAVGDDASTEINFAFKLKEENDLKIYKIDTGVIPYTSALLVEGGGNDYTIVYDDAIESGTITLTAVSEAGFDYLAIRETDLDQALSIPRGEARLNTIAFEVAWDKLAMAIQDLNEKSRRSIKFAIESESLDQDIEDLIVGRILIVNATGDGVTMSELTYDALLVEIAAAQAAAEAAAAAAAASAAAAAGSEAAAAASAAAASASEIAAAASAAAAAVSAAAAAASAIAAAASAAEAALALIGEIATVEAIAGGGVISHSANGRQTRTVVGNAGPQAASLTPFGVDPTNFTDGMEMIIVGTDDANYVQINPTDIQYGVLDRVGIVRIKKGDTYRMIYLAEIERFVGSRNS